VVGQELVIADGMIVYVFNDSTVTVIPGSTGWTKGSNANTLPAVALDSAFLTSNVQYPADFEMQFADHVIDTSTTGLFFGCPPATPTDFRIWNLTDNLRMQFLFYDNDKDAAFTPGDRVVIVMGDSVGKPAVVGNYRTAWGFQQAVDSAALPPVFPTLGDTLVVKTTKPFRTGEQFQFKIQRASVDAQTAANDLDKIAVVPNPYVGAASWEPPNPYKAGRGERRIFFINLPAQCTIRVFTVRGNLVQTISHDAQLTNGQESWDLVTKDGMDLAYGIYVFHVDAPGIGEKIGRFAVIK